MATQYVMVVYNDRRDTAHLYIGIPQAAYETATQQARVDHCAGGALQAANPQQAHSILTRAATQSFDDYYNQCDLHGAVTDPRTFVLSGILGPATEFHLHRASP